MTVRLLVKSPVSFTNTFTVITALDFAEIFVMTQVIVWPSTASFSTISAPIILTVPLNIKPAGKLSITTKLSAYLISAIFLTVNVYSTES